MTIDLSRTSFYGDADQRLTGPKGEQGDMGPQGPAGPPGDGTADASFSPADPYARQTVGESLGKQTLAGFPMGTFATAQATQVPVVVQRIQTAFYSSPVYAGGAAYVRAASQPSHPGRLQTSDGSWWELAERSVTPQMFGAIGNGDVANIVADTYGCQAALDFSGAKGIPIICPESVYMIDGYKGARPSWTNGVWAHGGLIVPAGAVLRGAGRGKTIFRAAIANWRCILRVREGSTSIRHLTVDGNRANYVPILHGTTSANFGSVRGEGIIYEGGNTAGLQIDVQDVEVMNTGHYGIGVQNVKVTRANIFNTHFRNIGGDCIDVKWYSAPDFDKNLIIDTVYSDGCGYYFLGTGADGDDDSATNSNQTVVDVGGKCVVRNVHCVGIDSDPLSYGNSVVRLRAKLTSQSRMNAAGSTVDGVYVYSSKPAGTGGNSQRRIVGVQVNCGNVAVSNVYVENCFYGVRVVDSGEDVPFHVSLNNITARNCRGAAGDGMGISVSNNCRRVTGDNLHALECDIGFSLGGRDGSYTNVILTENTLGLSTSDALLQYNTLLGVQYSGNDTNTNAVYTPAASAMFNRSISMTGPRQVWQNVVSMANDSNWTGEDQWLGGLKFIKGDESGTPGEAFRLGARATGTSGGGFEMTVSFNGSLPLRVGASAAIFTVPSRFTGVNQLWSTFEASKNDDAWSGEGIWIGGHKWLSSDTSGTGGEVVRLGARATGASGSAFELGLQVHGTLQLRVRSNQYLLNPASVGVYADDAAAAAAGVQIGGIYETSAGYLKLRRT